MPNGLRCKLSKLRFQGKITQEEYKELIEKLEDHDKVLVAQIKWQTRWIPVSERLPKSLEDVLATDGVDMFVAFVREKTKGKYEWYSLDVNYDKNTPIEAWMPLPEPYRESEENADE